MLDAATKRRIDTARDILVGKVPDPKSQVEQITIALIYKFMDDIDAASEELGGERQFFAGDFARYGWPRLVRSGLGGHETLNLYAEAITRMPENRGIPALFREIFKNAYLPYRDPETLRAFLKIIDEFEYDHSERLGDAFEYLLSVLGSQGDAGQFRTPRHIIDFMVAIIDSKKDETVLDPACGTAGFLISSYKHIRNANTDDEGNSTLTPDEKGKLAGNFKGYDISPDMVRLSLVNMYLHGFVDPHIFEYDTLTSEDRWNEYADVILANPPFMSPKGGIRPHNRFSVKSKRSEVLFVDYMAEHLNPTGRAAIIVPEGIIFQSQKAHTSLRKMLVEDYLVAVVSLPAGVFQPYSGVKTSILLLDKALAKKADRIAFFKVENDGYDLGAQRRPIDKNDLPRVQAEICEYLSGLRAGESIPTARVAESKAEYRTNASTAIPGLIAEKVKIAASGEYNLSGERYREIIARLSRFPIVSLGEVADVIAGQSPPGKFYNSAGNGTPFYQGKTEFGHIFVGEPTKWTTDPKRLAEEGDILMSVRAPVGPVNLATQKVCIGRGLAAIRAMRDRTINRYIFYVLRSLESEITGSTGAAFASINKSDIKKIELPLPPLEVQREIVAEIEGYQRVIDGARAVIENYRSQIVIDPEWPMVELGAAAELIGGYAFKSTNMTATQSDATDRLVVKIGNIGRDGSLKMEKAQFHPYSDYLARFKLHKGDVVVAMTGATVGKVAVVEENGFLLNQRVGVLRAKSTVIQSYIFYLSSVVEFYNYCQRTAGGGAQGNIAPREILKYKIPLPPTETQQAIVAEIEAERSLVAANRELVERMEGKIRNAIGRVWSENKN